MKTIQIAPHATDCKVSRKAITGTMGRHIYTYTLPSGFSFDIADASRLITCFQQAIALASRTWQVRYALDNTFGVCGGVVSVTDIDK